MSTIDEVLTWRGQKLRSSDGDKLGTIEEIYLDDETGEPEWALVTTGLFGTKQSFVPLADGARRRARASASRSTKATVKDAPQDRSRRPALA